MGRPARKIYVVDGFAFIPLRVAPGLWIRVDASVVAVACPACKSEVNVPCLGSEGQWWTGTHYQRRREAAKSRRKPTGFTIIET